MDSRLVGGILLVTGTILGAAMLAFPVYTGMAGFFPAVVLFVIYWSYMAFTAFCMLEANLWVGKDANIISMAKHTLGRGGEAFSWVVYLFLLYSLMTGYVAIGGTLTTTLFQDVIGISLPPWAGSVPLMLFFGFFVYEGTHSVDLVNRVLMIGLAITYALVAIFLIPHIDFSLLARAEWRYLPVAISIVSTSFGYQIIIPTLADYLDRDVVKLKKAILIGSLIPLILYILWEFFSLSIIPLAGECGIIQGYTRGDAGPTLLACVLAHPLITLLTTIFSFFAVVTSLLGVSISLLDFLSDGLKIKKSSWGKGVLFFLTFIPPLVFTLTNPRAFFTALEYAGVFGVVILLGLLPTLMVWAGRYSHRFDSEYTAPGGKGALIASVIFSILIIAFELSVKLGWIKLFIMEPA